ncbi:hypothetical protein DAEQUDRAFT_722218 [Daedalea quercina L-15889]|uniref:Histone acetyltransferase n=1 Tax=Daedalea quercina L-15889 TaxID=1314783 RepID=A0A165T9A0_9APHY|nr:hypothetical protein DAEQUDRAFT_722218 [Daedalea quercina L-15889]
MSGTAYMVASSFQSDQNRQNTASSSGSDHIPIDPALNAVPVDPALLAGGEAENEEVVPPSVLASQPKFAHFRNYSQGPQGDPFAPQPSPYLPVEESTPLPVAKPPKKRRQPRREEECGFCEGDDSKNKHGRAESMVSCAECGRSTHPSCLNLPDIGDVMHSYPWLCHNCKRCEVCQKKERENKMILCERCDRGWHMDCLQPPLEEAPPGTWYCPLCEGSLAQDAQLTPRPDIYYPTKVPPATDSAFTCYPAPLPEHPTKLPPEHIAAYRSSSVASSSRLTDGRRQDTVGATDESEADPDGEATPAATRQKHKKKQRLKGKTPVRDELDADDATPSARPHKRARVRLASPAPSSSPTHKSGSGLRIRLPFRDKGKAREDDSSDGPKGMFDDILSPDDRDTVDTTILPVDKQRFERSRITAEERLYPKPPAPAPEVPETPGAGPSSRPLRSSHRQHPFAAPISERSESPARSTPGPQSQKASDGLRIRKIRFGEHDIDTWFDAPFPEEYANIPDGRLWYCEFCLKYMKSKFLANRHLMKCKMRFPPGDEIYRDGPISIFEVDGRKNKIYCQNLCLLSKMFLDHKSLFYDVEPFLFYVITEFDDVGARFVGYFSKEKRSPKDYNVSCIMTLPARQRRGWGQLLIDFSYLLSRKEQRPGSPEKPLSPLGAISYKKYWTFAMHRYFRTASPNPRLEDISAATGMTIEDICNTLMHLKMIRTDDPVNRPKPMPGQAIKFPKGRKNGVARKHLQRKETHDDEKVKGPFIAPTKYEIDWDPEAVELYLTNMETKNYVTLKPEKLKWSPFIVSRTRKSEQLPTANSETAQAVGAQAMIASDTIPAVVETATPTPGLVADLRDSGAVPVQSPFDLFDDDNVEHASSPSREVSRRPPEQSTAPSANAMSSSAPNDTAPEHANGPVPESAPAVAQPEEMQTDEQTQLELDEALARKLARDLQMSDRSLRRRGTMEARPEEARQRTQEDSPSVRKSRPAASRRASARVTASVSPVKAANGGRRVSQDDETGKRPLRSRTTEPDGRAAASARSASPRKRRRVESPPAQEIEATRTPLRRNSRRGVTEDPSPPVPRSQPRPTRRKTDTSARMPSPVKSRRSLRKPVSDPKPFDGPHEPGEDAGEPEIEMQGETKNSPLTGATSRHSVPSEDTVVVTPTAAGMNKGSPGGITVAIQPLLSTVDEGHAAPYDGEDGMDVDEDEKDDDYTANYGDQDAEGEPDDDRADLGGG